jgi:hypothetical protein
MKLEAIAECHSKIPKFVSLSRKKNNTISVLALPLEELLL